MKIDRMKVIMASRQQFNLYLNGKISCELIYKELFTLTDIHIQGGQFPIATKCLIEIPQQNSSSAALEFSVVISCLKLSGRNKIKIASKAFF